ncbi:MAG: hypothetical protein ACI8TP_003490 [Acidimicrobiales bacterium]
MAEHQIWSAEELVAMTPYERDRVIRAGIITDPKQIPAEVTERARRKADARITATEGDHSTR